MTKTSSTPAEAKKADERRKQREQEDLADVAWLMADPRGRRFMFRLLQRGRVFSPIYVPGAEVYKNAARHDFCLLYLSQVLTACPAALQVMQHEANLKEATDVE
jgi:hypothetical protein